MKFQPTGGDATQYSLGRGKLYLRGDTLISGAAPSMETWRDIGNVTGFTISQESEKKEHKTSLSGLQVVDLDLVVSQKMSLSFTADELSVQNIAMYLSGTLHTKYLETNVGNAAAIASDDAVVPIPDADKDFFVDTNSTDFIYGQWYDLFLNLPILGYTRAYDFQAQGVQAITVRKQVTSRTNLTGATTLTEGTHYELDRRMGMIRFLAAGGGVTRGDTIHVRWAAPTDADKLTGGFALGFDTKLNKVALLTNSGITCALKFVGVNPNDGDKPYEIGFHKVTLNPEGELQAIGDDWGSLSFTGVTSSITNPPLHTSPYGWLVARDSYNT